MWCTSAQPVSARRPENTMEISLKPLSRFRGPLLWWMDFYNERRPHSALDDRTPQEAYTDGEVARSPGLCPVSRQPKVA